MEFDYAREPGRKLLGRKLNVCGKPLVSIITPYYNAGRHFEQTYNCVMNQTFPWFEWIIADDGSNDGDSAEILKHFAGEDERITVFRQENRGTPAARNLAAGHSRTDILVPLDADDLIAPTYLEVMYWALHFNEAAGWAYSDNVGFGTQEYIWKRPFSAEQMKTENILVNTAAIRREAFEKVGGYDATEKHYNEDWHLWLRLLAQGEYPVHVGGFLCWYRRSTDGALHYVRKEKAPREASKRLIREAAKKVDVSVRATEYPGSGATGRYPAPRSSDWDRKAFATHEKTHVMLLLPWLEMGGADMFNLDICRRIDRERFEISVLTTVPAENSWRQRFEEYVTDVFDLTGFLDMKDFPEFISYFIRSREIDVLFLCNSYYGYYLVPWLRKEFPGLAVIDYVHMEEWYWRSGGYARVSGVMGEFLEKTYVCSERTRQVMIRDFGRKPESVETLYIGVDQEAYSDAAVEAGLSRRTLGISAERPIVLFPCRIHPQKRPLLMAEIAKRSRKEIPGIAFVVVGDGPQMEELRAFIKREKLGDTVFLAGRQNDVRPYYKDSSMTLICSLKEGLALTAYESLSMGRPVVTSDVGGQTELIDETVGRVLPLLQSEAEELDSRDYAEEEILQYVRAIAELLADRGAYEEMRIACRRRIEEGFSSELMIRGLERIMTELTRSGELLKKREAAAAEIGRFPRIAEELPALMYEIEAYEAMYKNAFVSETRNELMRIANSKWGRRCIKLAFKLKLNRLFR